MSVIQPNTSNNTHMQIAETDFIIALRGMGPERDKISWRNCRPDDAGLDTNGCPLGNSKFILLSDNLNICLWLSACQVEKINQLNNSWSNIYQRLSQPEAKSINTFNLRGTRSCKFYFIYAPEGLKNDWRATLVPSMTDLLLMVSSPELTPWWSFPLANGAHHKKPHSPTHPPDLYMGITFASFNSIGKRPSVKDWSHKYIRGLLINGDTSFRRHAFISSYPAAPFLRDPKIWLISLLVTSDRKILFTNGWPI